MAHKKRTVQSGGRRSDILRYVAEHPDRPLKTRALARALDVATSDYTSFRALVRELLDQGTLVLGPGRTLRLPEQRGLVTGTFRANPRGFGFIERPDQPSLYVPRPRTGGARDGDRVTARILRPRGRMPGPRAAVEQILERAAVRIVGVLERAGTNWLVVPQGRSNTPPIPVAQANAGGARGGTLVVVEPLDDQVAADMWEGRVIERLGDPRDARAQIRGVIHQHEIPCEFPKAVIQSARQAAHADHERDSTRRDLRALQTITIDPPDARDFDDAISIEPCQRGQMRLGVHIADVAYFVPPDGPIDRAARTRGTSVYFPGQAVPMLPEELSSDACSLRPGEPRRTRSVFLAYDRNGHLVDAEFCNSVIQSDARLTYAEVQTVLDGDASGVSHTIHELLRNASRLAAKIRQRRLADGMITLSLPEPRLEVSPRGRVTAAHPYHTSFAHTIIEMFMVEANEAVSRHLAERGVPHLRRVHAGPDPDAARNLRSLTPVLGKAPPSKLDRGVIRQLLEHVAGAPEETAVSYHLLRSLAQAEYSPDDTGHFALASDDYCHFTSPIRRYPDLTVHRLLDAVIRADAGEDIDVDDAAVDVETLVEIGRRASETERRAQKAEREARAILQLLYMRKQVGGVYDGVIVGVMPFGVFVQLRETLAEGVLRVGDFGPDQWIHDRQEGIFTGMATQRVVFLGQTVQVLVADVDLIRQEMTLVPADGGPIGRVRSGLRKHRKGVRKGPKGRRGRKRA